MKFGQWIMEGAGEPENLDKVLDTIYDNCMPYLKMVNARRETANITMMSGRSNKGLSFIDSVRLDRKPVDTPPDIHKILDDTFDKKFGFRARSNAIFVTGDYYNAEDYGDKVYMIYPIGNFKFVWSNSIVDLYGRVNSLASKPQYKRWCHDNKNEIMKGLRKMIPDAPEEVIEKQWNELLDNDDNFMMWRKDAMIDFMKHYLSTYNDTNLEKALTSKHEIMLNCKTFFAVSYSEYAIDVIQHIRRYGTKRR